MNTGLGHFGVGGDSQRKPKRSTRGYVKQATQRCARGLNCNDTLRTDNKSSEALTVTQQWAS
eukprot:3500041-Amphidinium_carterae.1